MTDQLDLIWQTTIMMIVLQSCKNCLHSGLNTISEIVFSLQLPMMIKNQLSIRGIRP